jgi:hypothetical protein
VAAVDAPLVVPNETGRRPCEALVGQWFARFGAGAYPANRGNPCFLPQPRGARLAAEGLQRLIGEGGTLYLSTPIGRERVCFNAHRVFAPATILSWFPQLRLKGFSYVSDDGALHEDALPEAVPQLEYGCGFFEFQR